MQRWKDQGAWGQDNVALSVCNIMGAPGDKARDEAS